MAHKDIAARVMAARFDEEPDRVSWNPHLSTARRAWEMRRIVFSRGVPFLGVGGGLFVLIGFAVGSGFAVLGALMLLCGIGVGLGNLRCLVIGRCIHLDGLCRLDEVAGIVLFRCRDFTGMGASAHAIASRVIDAVDELRDTPARAWLDPALPSTAHRLAWRYWAAWTAPAPRGSWPSSSPSARLTVTWLTRSPRPSPRSTTGSTMQYRLWPAAPPSPASGPVLSTTPSYATMANRNSDQRG